MATLTAYGAAQGYSIAVLINDINSTSVTGGVTRLSGSGFIHGDRALTPTNPLATRLYKYSNRNTGQTLESASSIILLPGHVFGEDFSLFPVYGASAVYVVSFESSRVWKSIDETTFTLIQTRPVSGFYTYSQAIDPAGFLYTLGRTSGGANWQIYKTNLTTLARTLIYSFSTTSPSVTINAGIALNSSHQCLYIARGLYIDVFCLVDGVVSRTIPLSLVTSGTGVYDVAVMTGVKAGQLLASVYNSGGAGSGVFEIDIATGTTAQIVVTPSIGGAPFSLFTDNQLGFTEYVTNYNVLTMPAGSGISKGSDYDSTLGGDACCGGSTPDAPENVEACKPCCELRVKVTWDAVTDADSYNIKRDGVIIANVPATPRLYTDRAVPIGSTYVYSVAAVVDDIEGDYGAADGTRVRGFTEDAVAVGAFTESATTCGTFTEDAVMCGTFTEDGCGCD